MSKQGNTGFTLVELLVTIAIVGILSSLAIMQYEDYKSKARKVVFTSAIMELGNLYELEYVNAHTYANLGGNLGWIPANTTCDSLYGAGSAATSSLKSAALPICNKIVESSSDDEYELYVLNLGDKYSIQGWIDTFQPFSGSSILLQCKGSSGKSLDVQYVTGAYEHLGCNGNP